MLRRLGREAKSKDSELGREGTLRSPGVTSALLSTYVDSAQAGVRADATSSRSLTCHPTPQVAATVVTLEARRVLNTNHLRPGMGPINASGTQPRPGES